MKFLAFIFILILLPIIIPHALAETIEDKTGCETITINDKIYRPFRISMNHEPTTRKLIEDVRPSADSQLFIENPSATYLSFYGNDTGRYVITVKLEHSTTKEIPRQILIGYSSENSEIITSTLLYEGFSFCRIFDILVKDAPHIFTEDEILEKAGEITKEKFTQIDQRIVSLQEKTVVSTNISGTVSILSILIIVGIIVAGGLQRRTEKKMKQEFKLATNDLHSAKNAVKVMEMHRTIETEEKMDKLARTATTEIRNALSDFMLTIQLYKQKMPISEKTRHIISDITHEKVNKKIEEGIKGLEQAKELGKKIVAPIKEFLKTETKDLSYWKNYFKTYSIEKLNEAYKDTYDSLLKEHTDEKRLVLQALYELLREKL